MADVELIEPGERRPLVLGADVAHVPIGHPLETVGVERRDLQEDHVVQDLEDLVGVRARELVGEVRRHLARADLGGVNPLSDEDDGRALVEELLELATA